MSEMVERVAKALWEHGGDGSLPRSWKLLHSDKKPEYRHMARAAIEAMRRPTDAMVDVSYDVGCGPGCLEVWVGMIDAALKDG